MADNAGGTKMVIKNEGQKESTESETVLQAFANARQKPAIFLFLAESMQLVHAVQLRTELNGRQFDELDLVINSLGGSVHAAYQIVELARLHSKKLNACVPFWAKSAATLLCVGADKIIIDELAQLGKTRDSYLIKIKTGDCPYETLVNTSGMKILDLYYD